MTPTEIGFFPFYRGIIWSSLVKIQYTELKLPYETTLLSKNIFMVTETLTFDLMTPKYIRCFPFDREIMWSSLVKIQYIELKLCGNDPVVKNSIYSNSDLDL
jgi:hypothetical protein